MRRTLHVNLQFGNAFSMYRDRGSGLRFCDSRVSRQGWSLILIENRKIADLPPFGFVFVVTVQNSSIAFLSSFER
jgi:hypothetical protein